MPSAPSKWWKGVPPPKQLHQSLCVKRWRKTVRTTSRAPLPPARPSLPQCLRHAASSLGARAWENPSSILQQMHSTLNPGYAGPNPVPLALEESCPAAACGMLPEPLSSCGRQRTWLSVGVLFMYTLWSMLKRGQPRPRNCFAKGYFCKKKHPRRLPRLSEPNLRRPSQNQRYPSTSGKACAAS